LSSLMRAICPIIHILLDSITLMIFGVKYAPLLVSSNSHHVFTSIVLSMGNAQAPNMQNLRVAFVGYSSKSLKDCSLLITDDSQ